MKTIEITIAPSGELSIDAVGFHGADCEQATRFLEEALGVAAHKVRKPEYQQRHQIAAKQRIGG